MVRLKIILRKKIKANGEYPICLRYLDRKKTHYITLNISCKLEDWNGTKSEFTRKFKGYKVQNNALKTLLIKGTMIVTKYHSENKILTFERFRNEFLTDSASDKINIKDFWESLIIDLENSGSHGTAKTYKDTKRSFFKYAVLKKVVYFEDLDYSILEAYEVFLRSKGGTDGGISVKMRCLKAVYNKAIKRKVVNREYYPFELYKTSKLKVAPFKRAMSLEEIEKLKKVDVTDYPSLLNAKNYFLFSYYTGGTNFADLAVLQWININNNRIEFIRSKTGQKLSFKITKVVKDILNYYKKNTIGTSYIFPILLKDGMTTKQIFNRKQRTRRQFNIDLKELAKLAEIDSRLTSYVIRHSFGTSLYYKGVSFEVISESYGHSNPSITKGYLKDLGVSRIDDALDKL